MHSNSLHSNTQLQEDQILQVRNFIVSALQEQATSHASDKYEKLVKQLTHLSQLASGDLVYWYLALKQCVSAIHSTHHMSLISSLYSFSFWKCEDLKVNEQFIQLLEHLTAANGTLVVQCLEYLISNFLPKKDTNLDRKDIVFDVIHNCLSRIIRNVPSASPCLFSLLAQKFPHKRHSIENHTIYVDNCLRIISYCSWLKNELLAVIIEHILLIDVEIELDDGEDDEDLLFEMDGHDGGMGHGENSEMAEKLDVLMMKMFQYLDQQKTKEEASRDLFHLLLKIFDTAILPTHKSKYTQFLLFFLCSTNNEFSTAYIAYLLNKLIEDATPPTIRVKCAAYIASFSARAKFVNDNVIKSVLNVLIQWIHQYLDVHGRESPDADRHQLFYSVNQIIYYIFCFKHDKLVAGIEGKQYFVSLRLDRAISSTLNPFKICFQPVVREFAALPCCEDAIGITCRSVLQSNEHLILATKSAFGGVNQLESFFPYDPYLLKQSSQFLSDFYVNWVREGTGPEEDEEDDADGEDESAESEEGHGHSEDELDGAIDIMSFTPDVAFDLEYHFRALDKL